MSRWYDWYPWERFWYHHYYRWIGGNQLKKWWKVSKIMLSTVIRKNLWRQSVQSQYSCTIWVYAENTVINTNQISNCKSENIFGKKNYLTLNLFVTTQTNVSWNNWNILGIQDEQIQDRKWKSAYPLMSMEIWYTTCCTLHHGIW